MLILFKTYNNFTIFLQNPNEKKKNHEFSASSKRKQNSKKNIDWGKRVKKKNYFWLPYYIQPEKPRF